jgi:hypothetical protein
MLSTRCIGAVALSLCAGLATTTADAEIFQRISGDQSREHAFSIGRTFDGGYVTTGFRDDSDSGFAEDVLITKHFSDGSIEWQRRWRGPGRDIGYSVQQTPDGGYIVAAETTSSDDPLLGILLIRLDAAGMLVWNRYYAGSFMTDPIHTPHPGVALDQGVNGRIYVTGSVAGDPLVLAVGPGGALLWEAVYTHPFGPQEGGRYNFTDIKYDRISGTLVVSGTSLNPNFGFPGAALFEQDAFLMRTRIDGTVVWSWDYDYPFDLDPDNEPIPNVRETGDGLDIGPNGDIILNGRTDFGGPGAISGTHLVAVDPAGFPTWSAEYSYFSPDGVIGSPATAYAAVRFDEEFSIVQTGRVPDAAGRFHAWESRTDFGGAPVWFWEYGGDKASRGESVIPTPDPCGYAMAGQFLLDDDPFRNGETYLVKNNDRGESGCLERRWEFQPEFQARQDEAPIRPNYVDENRPAEDLLDFADAGERVFCYDDDCEPGEPPCPCDINGDGILDLADIGGFIACFTGSLPCGDLNTDGIWDLADVSLFISCFTSGCP